MAIFVGEGMTIVCAASDPSTQTPITAATAVVDFFAPGKNPVSNVGDREPDKGPLPMTFDPDVVNKDGTKGAYIALVDTSGAGWVPGKWTYRVTISDALDSWEYATVTLKA
jgi:hypothetical protein